MALLATVSMSCVSLDEDVTGQPVGGVFFQNVAEFESFINGAYSPIAALYGTDQPYIAASGGEDIKHQVLRWTGFEEANIASVGNPDEVTTPIWRAHYQSISISNTIIAQLALSDLMDEEKELLEAEAKFMRAFNYFNLVRWFGEIVYITEENVENAVNEPQSSIESIYENIIEDLKFAENLPETQDNPSKPTFWTAKALLSKVYLAMAGYPLKQEENYALARDKAKEVIDNASSYDLEPNYQDLWFWENRYTNKESMFTLYVDGSTVTGVYISISVRPLGEEGGWNDFNSDKRFLADFPVGDNSRVDGTFYLTMLNSTGTPSWDEVMVPNEPFVGKLRDAGTDSGGYYGVPQVTRNTDGFFTMLRYAEVLLIYAEAANMAEGSPSALAYNAINRVRNRAGLDDLSGLNQSSFDAAVIDERAWEFAFEGGSRWFDLCRKELVEEKIGEYYPTSVITKNNYLLPKPYDQLSIMLGLTQNSGY